MHYQGELELRVGCAVHSSNSRELLQACSPRLRARVAFALADSGANDICLFDLPRA